MLFYVILCYLKFCMLFYVILSFFKYEHNNNSQFKQIMSFHVHKMDFMSFHVQIFPLKI